MGVPSSAKADARLVEAVRHQLPTDASLQTRLLAQLQDIDTRLTAAGVTYWVPGGTLLGAVRHQGFIPHDDDIDIEIPEAELPRAIEALGKVGRSYRDGGQWEGSTVRMGRFFWWGLDKRFPSCVDVFLREPTLDKMAEFPSHEEVYPLERVPFHNITVMAPHRSGAEIFLARCYSASWANEVAVWTHSSRSREMILASLAAYTAAMRANGYTVPSAAATAIASLEAVELLCPGELNEELWQGLGWASPLPLGCDGVDGYDPLVLDMLGLSTRAWPVCGGVVVSQRLSASGKLEELQSHTGANITLLGEDSPVLRAVGSDEELTAVENELTAAEWWPNPDMCTNYAVF